jgi:uncharacterized protein YecE (DUF72 family)
MGTPRRNTFLSGTSGLFLPFPKYKFPEKFKDRSRLAFYSSLFDSIEINRSFYILPRAQTLAKWSLEVPEDFRFTFKLWKQVTHGKGSFQSADVVKFMNAISAVGQKKGCLLIQFPASVKSTQSDVLYRLLSEIKSQDTGNEWRLAIEFRDRSWYNEDIFELIDSFGSTIVIHDKAGVSSSNFNIKSDFIYVRFHGPLGNYRGSYTDDFLNEYAGYVKEWLNEGKQVFVYFNNTMGDAFSNLQTFNRFIEKTG